MTLVRPVRLAVLAACGLLATATRAASQPAPVDGTAPPPVPRAVASGVPAATAQPVVPSAGPAWLDHVNAYRLSANLPLLTENATWSAGDVLHARYTVKTDVLAHSEDPSSPWYTPEGHAAASNGNVMASWGASPPDEYAIDLWMQGPFHAVGILDPRLAVTGFGSYRESGSGYSMAATLDVLRGRTGSLAGVTFPIAWPGHGQSVPLTSYGGSEYPNPLTSCPGYTAPSGLPIVLQLGSGSITPAITASSFGEGPAALEHCVFSETTYTNAGDLSAQSLGRAVLGGRDAIVIIPKQPLAGGHTYTVSITANGQTYTWSFTVGAFGSSPADADGDSLPDSWETLVGLDPASGSGANGPGGDPDGDGKTNAEELAAGTHPRGTAGDERYFAEGATGTFFQTRLALLNPNASEAHVWLRFLKRDGTVSTTGVKMLPHSRATVDPSAATGMSSAEFSTLVETDVPVVADRTMWWDRSGYGSHAETAQLAPSTAWYLAEGATHSGFDLFYLIQNPGATTADVRVRYLLPSGGPFERTYPVPPHSRSNVWVDTEAFNGATPLASTDVSAAIDVTNGVPVIVERAMYQTANGVNYQAGHESAGVTAPALSWYLAEGATGSLFDLFVLLANPDPVATATVDVRYLLTNGTVYTKPYAIPPSSRRTIWVDLETIPGVSGQPLANVSVSTRVDSTNNVPVIVERSMWWPGPTPATWSEAHNSPGATTTGVEWALAEGEVGGTYGADTYVLLANTSSYAGSAAATLYYEDGTQSPPIPVTLPPNSRATIGVRAAVPGALNRRFGIVVESLGATPAQIVVERAMYTNANGVAWAAGTDALATRLR